MIKTISLVSTPLHLYMAANVALSRPDEEHHLAFIDQPKVEDNFYLEIVKQWTASPFESVRIWPGRQKGVVKKYKSRKRVFSELRSVVESIRPDKILVGNDRRIEFQYSMHVARALKATVQGEYLDEGTFTYVGRGASDSISDKYIDSVIKKITYGFWWRNPPTVGASAWVDCAHVAYPELVHPLLKTKQLLKVDSQIFLSPALSELSGLLCQKASVDPGRVKGLHVIFSMPHESIYLSVPGYKETVVELLGELCSSGVNVGVKYHPRDSVVNGLGLEDEIGIYMIPAAANFEALFAHLGSSIIIGDVSSVLLVSRWLRPDINVVSFDSGSNPVLQQFLELYKRLQIPVCKMSDLKSVVKNMLIERRDTNSGF